MAAGILARWQPLLAAVQAETTEEAGAAASEAARQGTIEIVINTLWNLWKGFLQHLPLLVGGVVVLVVTWVFALIFDRVADRILGRFNLRPSLHELLRRMLRIAVWIVGIIAAMMVMLPDVTPGKVLAGLGLGSVAIGFAFKDIFENFFAGILILWRFPFENGDFISCQGIVGEVEDVTIRNTLIRQVSGELVVVPNAMIFKNPVDVLTHWKVRRVTITAGVAYGEDVDESRAVIQGAVQSCRSVSDDYPVEIFAREFADSSINFEVAWWTAPTPLDIRSSRDEVVAAIKRGLDAAGIEIPFPYRTLTFKPPLKDVLGDAPPPPRSDESAARQS